MENHSLPTHPFAGSWRRCLRHGLALALALGPLGLETASAQTSDGATVARPSTGASEAAEAWRFQGTLYGWMLGISGNLTARGQTVDVNASFLQVVQKSDSLAAFMGYFEANKGKVGFYTDLVWAKLGFDRSMAFYRNPMPGVQLSATTNTAVTTNLTILEPGGLYEFTKWAHAPGSFTALDGILGLRYWNMAPEVDLNVIGGVDVASLGIEYGRTFSIARSGGLDWIDPVIGLRLRHQFTPDQNLMVRGDVGGFGLGSQFTWQAAAIYTYSWQFSGYALAALAGYRALGVTYSQGSGASTAGIDAVLHGPLIGVSLRF